MIKKYRKLVVVMAVMIFILSLASTGFAANTMKKLEAYYKNITIFRNGAQANFTHEPFIVDGTTYVPVRDMSELLGKTVAFNPTTYRIDITDTPDANTIAMQTKLVQQEITIKNYEAKIKDLEAQLASKTTASKSTLSEMEKYLNKNYDEYKNVEFKYELSSKKNVITVAMYVDLDYDESAWNKITNSQIKSFIQSIVDELEDEFDDNIEGYIEDEAWDEELVSFYVNTKGSLVVEYDGSGSSTTSLTKMESLLRNEFKSTSNGITNVKLRLVKGDIYIDLFVTSKTWKALGYDEQDLILEDMYDYIKDEDFTETIYGNIYTGTTASSPIDTFSFDKNGNVEFD